MSHKTMLRMTAPLRESLEIPYHDIGPKDRPPRITFVAGLHGNELNGIFVLSRLADFLTSVEECRRPGPQLHARTLIIPAVNVLGVNTRSRHWPFDQTDINRMFPGYEAGETTQRIAHAVLAITRPAHYRVDIHSSNVDFEEFPQVRLYEPTEDERTMARSFGLPAVVERPADTIFASTIGHAWRAWGGRNFVIQAGQAGTLQLTHCARLYRALVAFLTRTGILEGVTLADEEEDVHYFGVDQTLPLVAETAGLLISHREVGQWLRAGDVIGHVYDGFEGKLLDEIKAPVFGQLSGLRRQPLLFEGDLIARLHSHQPLSKRATISLQGQHQ
ncbi:MAG: M14 family metallopeptidase [Candidatus Methylomirabilaceae bacterium]